MFFCSGQIASSYSDRPGFRRGEATDFKKLLAELHRDSLYPMMGKDAWVAGADRKEAPGPKPVRLGRRLRLRRQPPGSWQLWNCGVQRGVSISSSEPTPEPGDGQYAAEAKRQEGQAG
jgi:hypothetical protein